MAEGIITLARQHVKRVIIKTIAFIGIFLILYSGMATVFSNNPDFRIYQSIHAFYEEPANALQGVYIGSSNCYAFWNALVAWEKYGLAIFPYSSPSMPFYATEYIIREVQKTQPDAVFIINVNHLDFDDMSASHIHHLINYMPDSELKREMRDHLCDLLGLSRWDRLEFNMPWMRMRQSWWLYLEEGLAPKLDGLKAACYYENYLSRVYDMTHRYKHTDRREPLSENQQACLEQLLDFCEAEDIKVTFVSVPRGERTTESLARINTACDTIRQRGFPLLYLTDEVDAVHLDLRQDFYEAKHTNIHGSIKFTDYISKYLIETYGLDDRRGDPTYQSWDEGWARYDAILKPFVLDFETWADRRDYSLSEPRGVKHLTQPDGRVDLTWNPVKGAEGYSVYYKAGERGIWQELTSTEACVCEGIPAEAGITYYYSIVPVREVDGKRLYGNFSVSGHRVIV